MRNILPFYSEIYHLGKGSVPKRSFNVLNYSSSRNYLSDMRYKRDILPISYGLLDLKLLRPVSFEWKNNTLSHGTKLGFIAQEVKTVIPEAVTGSKEDYYGLNNSYLIAVLIQSYQDQQLDIQKRGDILKNIHTKWVLLEEKWRRIKEENTRLRKRGKKHDGS